MAFLIPDNLRSRSDVSAAIRRVATALKLGLDDDATVWFEPLFDATGEKPHLVALLPGNGIGVLEVLDVKTSDLLGTLRGRLRVERDGREVELEQPLVRAESFATVLRARIAAEPRLEGSHVPVAAAAVFPSIDREEAEARGLGAIPGLDLERCFFRAEIETARAGGGGADLHRRFARLLGPGASVDEALMRGLIQPEIVIEPGGQLTIFRPPEGDELIRVMDREQEALAKSMGDGHRVVRGVAGSGKTLILVYRAKLFAELHPRQRFLLTCYTRALAGELREYFADVPSVDVFPLFTLVARAINDADLRAPSFDDDPSGEQRAAVALRALEKGALPRYRAVFVDEAQDFGTNALRFAVSLADERFSDVLVVADAAQNVFRRQFNWKQAGIQAQGRTRILRKNYRNTREILELAYSFLVPAGDVEALDLEDENVIVPPETALRSGSVPQVVFCEPGELVTRAIEETKRLVTAESAPKQVALLTMGTRQAIDLERRLRSEGIEHYFLSDPQKRSNIDQVASAEEPVILSTVYSAKGLEFPSVVVCCTPRVAEDLEGLRSAIYVGMTRATERLVVVAEQDHVLAEDLAEAAAGRSRFTNEERQPPSGEE